MDMVLGFLTVYKASPPEAYSLVGICHVSTISWLPIMVLDAFHRASHYIYNSPERFISLISLMKKLRYE